MSNNNNNINNNNQDHIVWRNIQTRGFFRKHVKSVQAVSTSFVELQMSEQGQPDYSVKRVLLSDISDALIENRHGVSNGIYQGFSYGGSRYVRNYYGTSRSRSVSIADIVFLDKNAAVSLIFRDVADPNGVLNLIKAEHKRVLQNQKLGIDAGKENGKVMK